MFISGQSHECCHCALKIYGVEFALEKNDETFKKKIESFYFQIILQISYPLTLCKVQSNTFGI